MSLPALAARDETTGYSKRVPNDGSWADAFSEALAEAIANLPRPHPPRRESSNIRAIFGAISS